MLETYRAKLQGDRIIWNEEAPEIVKGNGEVDVFVTIITEASGQEELRPFGLAKGQFVAPRDFDEPLPDDVLAGFEN